MMEKNQLLEWCQKNNIQSIYELKNRTTISRQMLYLINRGEVSMTLEMALRLNKDLGIKFTIRDGKVILY